MHSLILPAIWCGGVLALATFVLVGRTTNGYDRSLMGPVSSILLIVLALAYAAGYPFIADLAGKHSARLGSPDLVLLLAIVPALVFAIPVAVIAPLRAFFVLVTVYLALLGQHYLPPLFPSAGTPLFDLGVRMLIALVAAVPVFLALFGASGWAWLIPIAFAIQLAAPGTVAYAMAALAPVAATGADGTTTAASASAQHLTAALNIAAVMLPGVLAFLALRRRPF